MSFGTDQRPGFSRTLGDSGRQPAGQSSFSRGISVVPDRLRGVFINSAGEPESEIGPRCLDPVVCAATEVGVLIRDRGGCLDPAVCAATEVGGPIAAGGIIHASISHARRCPHRPGPWWA